MKAIGLLVLMLTASPAFAQATRPWPREPVGALPDFLFDVSFYQPDDPAGNISRFLGGCIKGKCSATEVEIVGGCASEGGALVEVFTFEKNGVQRVKATAGPWHSILVETSFLVAGSMDITHRYRFEYEREAGGIAMRVTAASRITTARLPRGGIRRTEWVPFPKAAQIVPCALRIRGLDAAEKR